MSPHQWCTRVDKSLTTTDGDSERDEGSSTSRSGSRRNSDSDADDGSASSASDSELQSDAGEAALGVTQVPAVAMVLRPQQLPQMLSLLRGRTHAEHSVPRFWAAVQDAFTLGGARADARWTLALSAVTTVIMVAETHEDAERAAHWPAIKTKMVDAWSSGVEAVCESRLRWVTCTVLAPSASHCDLPTLSQHGTMKNPTDSSAARACSQLARVLRAQTTLRLRTLI